MIRRLMVTLAASVMLASCAKTPPDTRPLAAPAMFTSSIDHVIPLPRTVEPRAGAGFTLNADTVIVVGTADDQTRWIATYLADVIGLAAAPQPPRVIAAGEAIPAGAIVLELSGGSANPPLRNRGTGIESHEGYEMTVTPVSAGALRLDRAPMTIGLLLNGTVGLNGKDSAPDGVRPSRSLRPSRPR